MADDLLANASACLAVLRRELDGARIELSDETRHAPHAAALLSRTVFLCEAAVGLAGTSHRSAAAVLLRPAIECWIDCCYVLYCEWEAVLQLTSLEVLERQKLSRIWLGEALLPGVAEELAQLDAAVIVGREDGSLNPDFTLRASMSIEARLKAAITCRGAAPSYLHVYDYLYRMISFSEVHTALALEIHATFEGVS